MWKPLRLLVAVCVLAGTGLACSKEEELPPEPTPAAVSFPDAVPLSYYEECPPCGASFWVDSLVENAARQRFQVRVSIWNSGQRGELDLSSVASVAYALTGPQSERFKQAFPAEQRAGRTTLLLASVEPARFTLSHFLNARGQASAGPVIAAGDTWEGWFVYNGVLPADTKALILHVTGIIGDRDGDERGWISFATGVPFIAVEKRAP
jgi:hypothetical protein